MHRQQLGDRWVGKQRNHSANRLLRLYQLTIAHPSHFASQIQAWWMRLGRELLSMSSLAQAKEACWWRRWNYRRCLPPKSFLIIIVGTILAWLIPYILQYFAQFPGLSPLMIHGTARIVACHNHLHLKDFYCSFSVNWGFAANEYLLAYHLQPCRRSPIRRVVMSPSFSQRGPFRILQIIKLFLTCLCQWLGRCLRNRGRSP